MKEDFPLFDPEFPNIRLIWDATALGCLMRDPVLFYLELVQGYRGDDRAPLIWGDWYHKGIEARNRAICNGFTGDDMLVLALQAIEPAAELDWKEIGDKYRSYESLYNAITLYHDSYVGEKDEFVILPDGSPCVEKEFLLPLILPGSTECLRSPSGRPYMLGGYFDGLRLLEKKRVVVNEVKHTTSTLDSYLNDFLDNLQIIQYALATKVLFPEYKVNSVVVDACQLFVQDPSNNKDPNPPKFQRREFLISNSNIEGHLRDTIMWIKLAEMMAVGEKAQIAGLEPWWPRRRQKWGPSKDWWGVLKEPPTMREKYAKANFSQEEPWDPRKIREG